MALAQDKDLLIMSPSSNQLELQNKIFTDKISLFQLDCANVNFFGKFKKKIKVFLKQFYQNPIC